MLVFLFFFFQAEDGIRDDLVTGVQTCALPISAQQQYSAFHQIGEDWRKLLPTYVQNQPEAIFDPNKPQTAAVINNLMTHATQEAGSFTNAYGGEFKTNLTTVMNSYLAPLQLTPTKVSEAMTEAIVKRVAVETGLKLNVPTLDGQPKGESVLAGARGGGGRATGMTRAARKENTPQRLEPTRRLETVPPGSLPGSVPAVASPTAAVITGAGAPPPALAAAPAPPVAPPNAMPATPVPMPTVTPAQMGVTGTPVPMPAPPAGLAAGAPVPMPAAPPAASMPAIPVTPVTSAPLPPPAPAPTAPQGRALLPAQMAPAQLEAQKGSQQKWQEMRIDFRNANADSDKVLQSLEIMSKAQQLASYGMFAQSKVEMQRLVNALGLGDSVNVANIADTQTFNKAAYQVAIGMTRQLSARPSQLEFTGALQNTPNPEMDPRAASTLIDNMAATAYHLKDQYAAFEKHGTDNAFKSGTPNFEGFDQKWAIPNPLSSYSPGQRNYRAAPGTGASGVRMLGFDSAGKPVGAGINPAYVIEYHRTGPSPTDWAPIKTYK